MIALENAIHWGCTPWPFHIANRRICGHSCLYSLLGSSFASLFLPSSFSRGVISALPSPSGFYRSITSWLKSNARATPLTLEGCSHHAGWSWRGTGMWPSLASISSMPTKMTAPVPIPLHSHQLFHTLRSTSPSILPFHATPSGSSPATRSQVPSLETKDHRPYVGRRGSLRVALSVFCMNLGAG